MATSLDDFINGLLGTQSNPLATVNTNEFNGNSNDLLFTTDQQAGFSIAGGTTLTNISPTTALADATQGKVSLAVLIWLVILGLLAWWVMKRG